MPALEEMSRDELIVLAGEQAGRLAARDRQITALATQVADLAEANEQLTAKLERLEHLLSRNSGNSSLPPSMDDQPGRTRRQGSRSEAGRGSGSPASSRGRLDRTWPGARTRDHAAQADITQT